MLAGRVSQIQEKDGVTRRRRRRSLRPRGSSRGWRLKPSSELITSISSQSEGRRSQSSRGRLTRRPVSCDAIWNRKEVAREWTAGRQFNLEERPHTDRLRSRRNRVPERHECQELGHDNESCVTTIDSREPPSMFRRDLTVHRRKSLTNRCTGRREERATSAGRSRSVAGQVLQSGQCGAGAHNRSRGDDDG